MKFFKKPSVALVSAILVVYISTMASVNIKLTDKCIDVTDGFYDGVRVGGVDYPAVYDSVKELCSVSDEITVIAKNYGINTDELYYAQDGLESAVAYSGDDISYIGWCYDDFIQQLKLVENQLLSTGLSQRHTDAMVEYSVQIREAIEAAETNGAAYNETVREFIREYDRFPTSMWANLTDTYFPGYFSNM